MDEIKQLLLSAMDELDGLRAELSAMATSAEDVKGVLDDALRLICMTDLKADAEAAIERAKESRREMKKQMKENGEDYGL